MYKTRIFSNHNDVSYNDYITKKRRIAMTHPEIQKKIFVNNYYATFSCDKAPIKIVHFPTSYICGNTKKTEPCKVNILYPYGHYMCINESCNTCISTGQPLENGILLNTSLIINQNSQSEYNIYDIYMPQP